MAVGVGSHQPQGLIAGTDQHVLSRIVTGLRCIRGPCLLNLLCQLRPEIIDDHVDLLRRAKGARAGIGVRLAPIFRNHAQIHMALTMHGSKDLFPDVHEVLGVIEEVQQCLVTRTQATAQPAEVVAQRALAAAIALAVSSPWLIP